MTTATTHCSGSRRRARAPRRWLSGRCPRTMGPHAVVKRSDVPAGLAYKQPRCICSFIPSSPRPHSSRAAAGRLSFVFLPLPPFSSFASRPFARVDSRR
ncbi:hypothetical protein K523DRAFT_28357 [Schizophyllum commune Tattone D]|nr:hypothetical protein K523DRAFT_28357 [Schizophyllum commune Tattone D]